MTQRFLLPNIGYALAEEIDAALRQMREQYPSRDQLTHALTIEFGALVKVEFEHRPRHYIRTQAIAVAATAIRIATEGDADFDPDAAKT